MFFLQPPLFIHPFPGQSVILFINSKRLQFTPSVVPIMCRPLETHNLQFLSGDCCLCQVLGDLLEIIPWIHCIYIKYLDDQFICVFLMENTIIIFAVWKISFEIRILTIVLIAF